MIMTVIITISEPKKKNTKRKRPTNVFFKKKRFKAHDVGYYKCVDQQAACSPPSIPFRIDLPRAARAYGVGYGH